MIRDILDEHSKATKKSWSHDRTKTIGASEIGICARRVWYTKNKQDKDDDYPDDWGANVRGTVFEEAFWAPAMERRFGKKLLFAGKYQRTFVNGYLSATPDGLITGLKRDALKHLGVKDIESDCIMCECKTLDPRADIREAKAHNVYQTQVQLHLVRKLTKYKPVYSLLSYTNASFWSDVTEFCIKYDPGIAKVAELRAIQIKTAKSARDLPPEGWVAQAKECVHCPFLKPCGIERRNLPFQDAPVDPQFKAEVIDMCREIAVLEHKVEQSDIELRRKQQALKDRLREKSVKKIPGVVTWSNVKGRIGYDNAKIREAAIAKGIDVEQFSTVGDPTDRLQITLKDMP